MEPDTPETTKSVADSWLGVELRHLAALDAVAKSGSFGRAAIQLGYTQSAVSQQIATLERIVGERLVERPGGPRPISITEAGNILLRHAESIVARFQAAQADLAALSAGELGSLRVGTIQSVGTRILPEVMRRFTKACPSVEVELQESHSDDELADFVERGELDLSFVQLPVDNPALETIELLRDPYVLLTSADSDFGKGKRAPTLREIAAEPLIGNRACRATNGLVEHLRGAGCEPNFVFRSDDNGVVQGLAGAGVGMAIVPRLAVDENDTTVRIIDLANSLAPRSIGIAWHADRYHSPAAKTFLEIARQVTDEAAAAWAKPAVKAVKAKPRAAA